MDSHRIETLERLGRMLDEGKLSSEEYEALKGDIIGATSGDGAPVIAQDDQASAEDLPDRYQDWFDRDEEPIVPGWYPDPKGIGTHIRFHDGKAWTDSVRERRPPGWYSDQERAGRERYFDGLEFTYEYRPTATTQFRPTTAPAARTAANKGGKDWRFWVGLGLVALGALGVLKDTIGFSNEPIQDVRMFVAWFAFDPLIWGGAVGAFLLYRFRQPPTTSQTGTTAAPATRPRNPFWIDQD